MNMSRYILRCQCHLYMRICTHTQQTRNHSSLTPREHRPHFVSSHITPCSLSSTLADCFSATNFSSPASPASMLSFVPFPPVPVLFDSRLPKVWKKRHVFFVHVDFSWLLSSSHFHPSFFPTMSTDFFVWLFSELGAHIGGSMNPNGTRWRPTGSIM